MPLIVICGGGGKTTLIKKYPDLFLDIDDFIWSSYNNKYHTQLYDAITTEDMNAICDIYKTIMVNNRDYLQTQPKIILGHDPIYSEWIGVKLLTEMKPSIKLHELNIANRTHELKKIALRNWTDLSDAIIYDDWESFNKLILNYTGHELL
uniref:Deoxynucleoside kinase domain-containing protein n=1 Tax=viral metagenome TaxID=1070528 RepID=A0A6C0I3Z7_9ZZZZ